MAKGAAQQGGGAQRSSCVCDLAMVLVILEIVVGVLLAIIGVASLIAPIPVDPEFLTFDLWVMLGASLLIFPLVFLAKDLTRIWGVVLSALYLGYIALVII